MTVRIALVISIVALAMFSPSALGGDDAGCFEFNGCRAEWSDGELTISNGLFRRVLRAVDGTMQTVSLKSSDVEWIAATNGCRAVSGRRPYFVAGKSAWSVVGETGMRVTAAFTDVTNSYLVLPSVPGVIAERTRRVRPEMLDPALRAGDVNVGESVIREGGVAMTGADAIALAPRHVRVTAFDLYDRTDYTNELESEREWLLMMRELPRRICANVVSVEDTFTGEGLVFVRLAPLPEVRPEQMADYVLVGSQYGPCGSAAVAPVDNGWPIAEFAYSGGAVGRTAALQRFQRALRAFRPERDGVLLSNNWGGGHGDSRICEDFIMREIDAGAELGVDVLQIDDGWQKGRSANSSDIAGKKGTHAWGNFRETDPTFWEPCPVRLPHGLSPLVTAAEKKGMRFGLWYGPESREEARHWREDADCLLNLYREHGIAYFKIDSMKTPTVSAYNNQRRLFDTLLSASKGEMTFDLDVTCGERPGYFGLPHIGPLFVENRYTQHGGYWPHQTLRSLWSLAWVVDPVRMRIEFLDPDQYKDKYSESDPLRPVLFHADALFAIAMCASPLAWMELSGLSQRRRDELKPLIRRWKKERDRLHGGITHPIGSRPDGHVWSGFLTVAQDGGGYLLLFRMLNGSSSFRIDTRPYGISANRAEVIGGRGSASVDDGIVNISGVGIRDFVWVKLSRSNVNSDEQADVSWSGWAKGHFQLHAIHTGVAESMFMIYPDGTTMLLDCGDHPAINRGTLAVPVVPGGERHAGEWIARYVTRVNPAKTAVDYMVTSHFHSDHTGCLNWHAGFDNWLPLSGFAQAAQTLSFGKAIDRGWPRYDDPIPFVDGERMGSRDLMLSLYDRFRERDGLTVEKFRLGATDQFVPIKNASLCTDFKIRNLCANGKIAMQDGSLRDLYADMIAREHPSVLNENGMSLGMIVSYGEFSMFLAGDFSDSWLEPDGTTFSTEEALADAVSHVQVAKINHHGYRSMPEKLVKALSPQVFFSCVWDQLHDGADTMERIFSATKGESLVMPTVFTNDRRHEGRNAPWLVCVSDESRTGSHIVFDVPPGGKTFTVTHVDASDESMRVKSVRTFICK